MTDNQLLATIVALSVSALFLFRFAYTGKLPWERGKQ